MIIIKAMNDDEASYSNGCSCRFALTQKRQIWNNPTVVNCKHWDVKTAFDQSVDCWPWLTKSQSETIPALLWFDSLTTEAIIGGCKREANDQLQGLICRQFDVACIQCEHYRNSRFCLFAFAPRVRCRLGLKVLAMQAKMVFRPKGLFWQNFLWPFWCLALFLWNTFIHSKKNPPPISRCKTNEPPFWGQK